MNLVGNGLGCPLPAAAAAAALNLRKVVLKSSLSESASRKKRK